MAGRADLYSGVALQPELTPIRPPPALLSDRFQLCRHVTPTNYGEIDWIVT